MEFSDIIWMFVNPFEAIRGVRDFLEMGGDVLMLIMLETLVLWLLIFERFSYFRGDFKRLAEDALPNGSSVRSIKAGTPTGFGK